MENSLSSSWWDLSTKGIPFLLVFGNVNESCIPWLKYLLVDSEAYPWFTSKLFSIFPLKWNGVFTTKHPQKVNNRKHKCQPVGKTSLIGGTQKPHPGLYIYGFSLWGGTPICFTCFIVSSNKVDWSFYFEINLKGLPGIESLSIIKPRSLSVCTPLIFRSGVVSVKYLPYRGEFPREFLPFSLYPILSFFFL